MSDVEIAMEVEDNPMEVMGDDVAGREEEVRVSSPNPREHAPLPKAMDDDLDSLQALSQQDDEDRTQLSLSKFSDVSNIPVDEQQLEEYYFRKQAQQQQQSHSAPAAADDNSSINSKNHTTQSLSDTSKSGQIKINYAPVWKPGFQNRRSQSAYLKNAFPAGYQLARKRSQLSGSHYDHIMKKAETLGKSTSLPAMSHSVDRFSFVDWAKGSGAGLELSEDDDDLSDPYADCAGPLLAELQRARKALKSPSFDYIPQDPACIVKKLSIKPLMRSTNNNTANNSSSNKSLGNSTMLSTVKSTSQSKIFHAPSLLPTLNPSLCASNPFMTSNNRKPSPYDQWILDRRNNSNDKMWKQKGNDHTHNYSAYSFNGTEDALNFTSSAASTLPSVPQPWLQELAVEVYTINQVMRSESTQDQQDQILILQVPSVTTLQEVRHSIANEIVESIRRAFPDLPKLLNAPHKDFVTIQVDRIDMIFQYYNYDAQLWRPLQHEADWVQTKDYISNMGQPLKILYALEPQSEQLLVRQIQKNYELQKEAMEKIKPHISLQELTQSVLNSEKKKHHRAQSEPSPSRTKLKPLPPSNKQVLFASEQSVLYPKSSQKLKDMQQKAVESANRLDSYANNLENKILKTRF